MKNALRPLACALFLQSAAFAEPDSCARSALELAFHRVCVGVGCEFSNLIDDIGLNLCASGYSEHAITAAANMSVGLKMAIRANTLYFGNEVAPLGDRVRDWKLDNVLHLLRSTLAAFDVPDLDFAITMHDGPIAYNRSALLEVQQVMPFRRFNLSADHWHWRNWTALGKIPHFAPMTFPMRPRISDGIAWPMLYSRVGLTTFDADKKIDELLEATSFPWESRTPRLGWRGQMRTAFEDESNNVRAFLRLKHWREHGRGLLLTKVANEPSLRNMTDICPTGCPVPCQHIGMRQCARTSFVQTTRWKYILSVEGEGGYADREPRELLYGSVIVRQRRPFDATQWYAGIMRAGVHFVEVDRHFNDLEDTIAWLHTHDEEAKKIGSAGRTFAARMLRKQSLLEYAATTLRFLALFQSDTLS